MQSRKALCTCVGFHSHSRAIANISRQGTTPPQSADAASSHSTGLGCLVQLPRLPPGQSVLQLSPCCIPVAGGRPPATNRTSLVSSHAAYCAGHHSRRAELGKGLCGCGGVGRVLHQTIKQRAGNNVRRHTLLGQSVCHRHLPSRMPVPVSAERSYYTGARAASVSAEWRVECRS